MGFWRNCWPLGAAGFLYCSMWALEICKAARTHRQLDGVQTALSLWADPLHRNQEANPLLLQCLTSALYWQSSALHQLEKKKYSMGQCTFSPRRQKVYLELRDNQSLTSTNCMANNKVVGTCTGNTICKNGQSAISLQWMLVLSAVFTCRADNQILPLTSAKEKKTIP